MQTRAPHRWHVNLVLFYFGGGQVPQRCLVSKFMSSIKCFDLSPQVHTQQGAGPFWRQFLSFDGEGVVHSPACFSMKTTSWAGAIRAKLVCVVRLALVWSTPVLASVKGCWRGLLVNPGTDLRIGQTDHGLGPRAILSYGDSILTKNLRHCVEA